jgi:hypothetical protein
MTYNPEIYGQLLIEVLPSMINSQEEYDRLEQIFADLFDQDRTPEQEELFGLLATLLEDFERRTLPPLDDPVVQAKSEADGEVIFEYRGMIYNRPLGRGICFSEGELAEKGLYLEDVIPENSDLEIEIVVRKPKIKIDH